MQCPKCHYEPTMSEMQRSPGDCVKCGINYEGHARFIEEDDRRRSAERGEKASVAADYAPHVHKFMSENRGSQPVVIVDFHMSFNSMVWFMVKWAIAAIPAMIILAVLFWFLVVFLAGAIGGIPRA